MNDIKSYYENPFVTGLIKRDGVLGINEGGNFITEIVKKYLKHEMVTSIFVFCIFYKL